MISRRRMLVATGTLAGSAVWPRLSGALAANPAPRRIALVNLHTSERLEIEYFRNNAYVTEALTAIEVLLRDFRNGEKHAIDPKLGGGAECVSQPHRIGGGRGRPH
jgi:uncharacterized protein YcbK (DUF882 family)